MIKRSIVLGVALGAVLMVVGVGQAVGQGEAREYDEYGAIRDEDALARIDNFAIELQQDPASKGYVITYGARRGALTLAKTRSQLVLKHLKTRSIDPARLVLIDGGYREEATTELWIAPNGAAPPTATPTVDPKEVRAPKTAAPKKKPTKKRG